MTGCLPLQRCDGTEPPTVSVWHTLKTYLEIYSSKRSFYFQEIRNQSHECSYKVAKYPENRNRNRYRDVNPCRSTFVESPRCLLCIISLNQQLYMLIFSLLLLTVDHSRVKLKNTENDYINASLVVMEEAQRSYILTQASPDLFISLCFLWNVKNKKERLQHIYIALFVHLNRPNYKYISV